MNARRLKALIYRNITAVGGTRWGAKVATAVQTVDQAFKNDSADSRSNGETWLLESLSSLDPRVVLDVGANVGSWTSIALRAFPSATVHAFEPIEATYAKLVATHGSTPRVVTSNVALTSNDAGPLTMWTGSDSTLASTVKQPNRPGQETSVQSASGDAYCRQAGIDHIDLLKVDTEGHDLEVLRGFTGLIESGGIDVIQFEFTLFAVFVRTWLRDFHDLLGPAGYSIGKLYPSWIDWTAYDASDERYLRCNFVAARQGSPAGALLGLR